MRKAFWHTELIIDTERYYPPLELFELMRENLEEKFGSIIIKKILTLETISVQGVDGYVNKVTSMKWLMTKRGRIIIRQEQPLEPIKIELTANSIVQSILGFAKSILWLILYLAMVGLVVGLIIWCITQGILWLVVLIVMAILALIVYEILKPEGTKANRAMMKTLGEEIEKLVEGGT
jgi:uncharacterized membrane protein